MSEKLIELDHEISPSIEDIDKSIKTLKDKLESISFMIDLHSNFNWNKEKRENSIRRLNKRIEGIETVIRELQATKYISKKTWYLLIY